MPPWSFPKAFCDGLSGPTTTLFSNGASTADAGDAFCTSWTINLWYTCLFIALAFWIFITALNVLHSFEWGELSGYTLRGLMRVIAHQVWWLLAALASFYLLLLAHQFINQIVNIFDHFNFKSSGGLFGNYTYDSMLADTQGHIIWDMNCHIGVGGACGTNGTNPPIDRNNPAFFGYTWEWTAKAIGDLDYWLPPLLSMARFIMMLIIIGTSPIAFITQSHPLTKGMFRHWRTFWMELEATFLITALGCAIYDAIPLTYDGYYDHGGNNNCSSGSSDFDPGACDHSTDANFRWDGFDPTAIINSNYVRLVLVALVGGVIIAFLVRAVGGFITSLIGYFTTMQHLRNAEEQREWGIGIAVGEIVLSAALLPVAPEAIPLVGAAGAAIGAGVQASQVTSAPNGAGLGANGLASNLAGAGGGLNNSINNAVTEGRRRRAGQRAAVFEDASQQVESQGISYGENDLGLPPPPGGAPGGRPGLPPGLPPSLTGFNERREERYLPEDNVEQALLGGQAWKNYNIVARGATTPEAHYKLGGVYVKQSDVANWFGTSPTRGGRYVQDAYNLAREYRLSGEHIAPIAQRLRERYGATPLAGYQTWVDRLMNAAPSARRFGSGRAQTDDYRAERLLRRMR